MSEDLVKISVNGREYETPRSLLEKPLRQQAFKSSKTSDVHYNFSRHSGCFEAALDYLNNKELHMPNDICPQVFIREMEFWGVDVNELKSCCKVKLDQFLEEMNALKMLTKADTPSTINKGTWRGFFHQSLEEPNYSYFGQAYFWFSMGFVAISIFSLCAETMPEFRSPLMKKDWKEYLGDDFDDYRTQIDKEEIHDIVEDILDISENETRSGRKPKTLPKPMGVLNQGIYYLSLVCGCFFTFDLIFRFIVFIERKRFLASLLNIIDTVAVFSFFCKEVLITILPSLKYTRSYIDAITAVSAIRVFRIFRLVDNSSGLRVFLLSIQAGFREIWLLFLLLAIGTLIFSSIFYFCERPDNIDSIPGGFWWAIITMTTVGYGDIVPRSTIGKVVGSICAISGVLVMAVTVPIFASKFALYYHRVGRSRSTTGGKHRPFRRYSSFVKPMPEYGSQK